MPAHSSSRPIGRTSTARKRRSTLRLAVHSTSLPIAESTLSRNFQSSRLSRSRKCSTCTTSRVASREWSTRAASPTSRPLWLSSSTRTQVARWEVQLRRHSASRNSPTPAGCPPGNQLLQGSCRHRRCSLPRRSKPPTNETLLQRSQAQ